ncbi:MAG TPA: fibronectin type III domain-containing protein [Candidatus Binatia bacterium]|nr:fibronectin type III domain-containing protein [Candidatus Binatia bacterium]
MTAGRRRALGPLLAAALVLIALPACGRKGTPVAPERRLPQPVADLRGVVRDGGIELAWSVPARRVDNTRLLDPGLARVFRAEDAGQGEPRLALLKDDRVAGYTEVATVRLADPPSPLVRGGRVAVTDRRTLALGRRYTYVVVTVDTQGRSSAPSPRVSLTFVAAPEPPADFRAEPGDGQARLSWRPPARLTDGSAVSGPLTYEILRAPAADAPLAPIARTTPDTTSATDRGLENDRTYYYAIRALRQEGATRVEGEPTTTAAVTPVDVTPPPPPTDLVAIPSERTVRLSWTPSAAGDVAVHVVYRALGSGPLQRVGAVRVPGATFIDQEVPPGTYRYAVTAQDAGARANESRPSNEVTVTVP